MVYFYAEYVHILFGLNEESIGIYCFGIFKSFVLECCDDVLSNFIFKNIKKN